MSEQSGKNNSMQERPAGQNSPEKNGQIGQKQLVWYMDTMILWCLGEFSMWGVSELLWIWVGRWPHQDCMGRISASSSTPCSLPGWSHLTCLPCASQFPMSCAIKSYPWSRIIVKNMVRYFHLTNHCVFSPWYTNPGSKTWPMLTHLTLNPRYYC